MYGVSEIYLLRKYGYKYIVIISTFIFIHKHKIKCNVNIQYSLISYFINGLVHKFDLKYIIKKQSTLICLVGGGPWGSKMATDKHVLLMRHKHQKSSLNVCQAIKCENNLEP